MGVRRPHALWRNERLVNPARYPNLSLTTLARRYYRTSNHSAQIQHKSQVHCSRAPFRIDWDCCEQHANGHRGFSSFVSYIRVIQNSLTANWKLEFSARGNKLVSTNWNYGDDERGAWNERSVFRFFLQKSWPATPMSQSEDLQSLDTARSSANWEHPQNFDRIVTCVGQKETSNDEHGHSSKINDFF